MLKPRASFKGLLKSLPSPLHSSFPSTQAPWICVACQSKSQWQYRRASSSVIPAKLAKTSTQSEPLPPKQQFVRGEGLTLETLESLIGVEAPPRIGENPAKDTRPWSERNDEYWEKEAHAERKKQIYAEASRGYYLDWKLMRHHKGKTFLAPESPFRANVAKYFPNFQGYTLADSWSYVDTTKLLKGKVSIVSYSSQTWAAWQTESFVGKKGNPELATALEELKDQGLQKMFINYEDNLLKKYLIYLFLWHARRKSDREHGKDARATSLIVTRGINREFLEDGLGITNLRVGFTYLVDYNCKIRWVGTGYATEEEKASLVRIARRLVHELKNHEESKKAMKLRPVQKKKEKQPKPIAAMMI